MRSIPSIPMVVAACQLATAVVLMAAGAGRAAEPNSVQQWDVFEVSLPGPSDGNPFVDVTLSARFTSGNDAVTVPGFYDGAGVYRLRFSPPKPGPWAYVTLANRPELDGKTGTFTAAAATGANHGPVRVHDTFHFAYADGTPYFQVGTTCYAWTHQPDDLQEQTLRTLAASPFNKVRMCIFPKFYQHNRTEPANFPFVRHPDGRFDFARFNPENWRHFERRVAHLGRLGIQADVILFHPYDHWGFSEMDHAADDRYVRYAIARLAAYRNVWWSLANEYDFMVPTLRKGERGNKTVADFDRFFSIIETEDPVGHLRGIHHGGVMYDHTRPWVTHASIQNGDLANVLKWREEFKKPVVVDECQYEGNITDWWGHLTGHEMVHKFWLGTLCGGYVGHGETFADPNDILWWSKGGVLHGESPARIAFLKKTMEALPYWDMTPTRHEAVFTLAKPGTAYLVFATKPGPITVELTGNRDYTVEALDTWEMTAEKVATAKPGPFTFTAPRGDYLLRITPIP